MLGTYPVNSYLCRIKKVPSPICTHYNSGDVETLAHFLKYALNVIMLGQQHIIEYAKADLSCCRGMPQLTGIFTKKRPIRGRTVPGLQLRPVVTALVQQTGQSVKDNDIQQDK